MTLFFCNEGAEEPALHLFWDCPFPRDCWASIITYRQRGTYIYDEILLAHQNFPKALDMDIIILGRWNLYV